ncbi:MAG TPA: DUF3299 domain-containing protein, partial [Thiolinea sp.]|nr:DUF3299 domain-containing protein [Thiolinea sp.]
MFLQFGLSACHEQAANNSTKPLGNASLVLETAEIPTAPTPAIIVKTLDWIDLLPATINREALMEHYADLVIQRLDPETEASTQEKIINELNQAQGNASLDGLYVRLAGYMAVLDDREGQISEFILAPYSGAGIHQPAPAANQMILVHPQKAYKLADADQYQSVWVEGRLKLQNQVTSISP